MTIDAAPLALRLQALMIGLAEEATKAQDKAAADRLTALAIEANNCADVAEHFAVLDGGSMTAMQAIRIARLLTGSEIRELKFGYRPFDLPTGYVTVSITTGLGRSIFGGISPEGEMST